MEEESCCFISLVNRLSTTISEVERLKREKSDSEAVRRERDGGWPSPTAERRRRRRRRNISPLMLSDVMNATNITTINHTTHPEW